jgi:hypothetical protein
LTDHDEMGLVVAERPHASFWLVASVAFAAFVAFGVTWLLTGLGGPLMPTLAACAMTLVGVVAVVLLAPWLTLGRRSAHWASVIVAFVACLTVVAISWSGTLVAVKMRADESSWLTAANTALRQANTNHQGCFAPPETQSVLPEIGAIVAQCVLLKGSHNDVQVRSLQREGPGATGVLSMPSNADITLQWDWYVVHVNGPWWHVSSTVDATCPPDLNSLEEAERNINIGRMSW